MVSIALLVRGAIVNAVAFSGSNYIFSMLRGSKVDAERKRHDLAIEQLQAAQAEWSRRRTEQFNFINEELRCQNHAIQTFQDISAAMCEYGQVTSNKLDPQGPEPVLSNFYTPSKDQKNREIAFVILSMGLTGLVAHELAVAK